MVTPHPITVPTIPKSSVTIEPPGSRPGMIALAASPTTVPKPIQVSTSCTQCCASPVSSSVETSKFCMTAPEARERVENDNGRECGRNVIVVLTGKVDAQATAGDGGKLATAPRTPAPAPTSCDRDAKLRAA